MFCLSVKCINTENLWFSRNDRDASVGNSAFCYFPFGHLQTKNVQWFWCLWIFLTSSSLLFWSLLLICVGPLFQAMSASSINLPVRFAYNYILPFLMYEQRQIRRTKKHRSIQPINEIIFRLSLFAMCILSSKEYTFVSISAVAVSTASHFSFATSAWATATANQSAAHIITFVIIYECSTDAHFHALFNRITHSIYFLFFQPAIFSEQTFFFSCVCVCESHLHGRMEWKYIRRCWLRIMLFSRRSHSSCAHLMFVVVCRQLKFNDDITWCKCGEMRAHWNEPI